MKPTADNVKLILDRFFANVKLIMVGHNLPDPMIKSGGPATIDKSDKGMTIVSCSGNAEFAELHNGLLPGELPMVYTLKHYPGDRETPPETVETPYKKYETAEAAARDLINFWIEDYWEWAVEGIYDDQADESLERYQKRVASAEYPRGEGAQADGQG